MSNDNAETADVSNAAAARQRLRESTAPPILGDPKAPVPPLHLPIIREGDGGAWAYTDPQHDDDDVITGYRQELAEFLNAGRAKIQLRMDNADLDAEVHKQRIREQAREQVKAERAEAAASAHTVERARPGGDAILDEPDTPPAVWGSGTKVAWAKGQGMMLASHQGLGKTTLAQQLVLHRMRILQGRFLGMPVEADGRPVLYLAMDRPSQANQSFRRMVTPDQRQALNDALTIWGGPLPINIASDTSAFADFVEEACPGCGTVVVDSVKDLIPGISKDEVGSALNIAWQELIARGVELLLLHHQRKAQQGAARLNTLDDVYGSTWLTSGLGSVFALEGEPGSPRVTLRHLKLVIDPIGPLTLRHDHQAGHTTTQDDSVTATSVLYEHGDEGATVSEVAAAVLGRAAKADLQVVRRQLRQLAKDQLARKEAGANTSGGSFEDRWFLTDQGKWAVELGGRDDD